MEDIAVMLAAGEGQEIEFKENIESGGVINTICAFANTGGGKLIIGIVDKTREIVGVADAMDVQERITNKIWDKISPRFTPKIYTISYLNKSLVVVEVHPRSSEEPHAVMDGNKKSIYIRFGPTTRIAEPREIQSIKAFFIKSFDESPYDSLTMADIDLGNASKLLHKTDLTLERALSLGILTKSGEATVPTVGGVILFCENRLEYFHNAKIDIAIFNGKTKTGNIQTQDIKDSLLSAIDIALDIMEQHISAMLSMGVRQHAKVWAIPERALREALVNAIVHNDYALTNPIKIRIFDDRIEIENNAIFLGGLVLEDLTKSTSEIRNLVIAKCFKMRGYIEAEGTGIEKIIKDCREYGIRMPQFERVGSHSLRVTFFKEKIVEPEMDGMDVYINDLILLCGALSTSQISVIIGRSRSFVGHKLARLVAINKLIEIGANPNDPKKVYSLRDNLSEREARMSQMIIDMQWDHESAYPSLKIYIALGRERICLVLEGEDIDDFFVDAGSGARDKCEEDVKKVLLSLRPELGRAIVDALANEKIQKMLKQKQTPKILLMADRGRGLREPQRFLGADVCAPFPIVSRIGFRKH